MNELNIINAISCYLEKFHTKTNNIWAFRCPFCGDSKKDKNKTRGYIYYKDSKYSFHCFNCNYSCSLKKFVALEFPDVFQEYLVNSYRRNENNEKEIVEDISKVKIDMTNLVPISKLFLTNTSHECIQYIKSRKIPAKEYQNLYYCENFGREYFNFDLKIDKRLIFPYQDINNSTFALSGRSIEKNPYNRYINYNPNKESLIFGLNKVDFDKHCYILEGIIDSLFLENALAVSGVGFIKLLEQYNFKSITLVLDNQPRNVEVINIYSNLIDYLSMHYKKDWYFYIWNKKDSDCKDVNDLVKKYSKKEARKIITENSIKGNSLKFILEYKEWKRNGK